MKISDFDYDLPENLIAKQPPKVRGASRLLVLERHTGDIIDKKYADLVDYLRPGDVLVLNDTRVIKARLTALKASGARREILILEKHGHDDDWQRHKIMHRGSLAPGEKLHIISHNSDLSSPGSDPGDAVVEVMEVLGGGLAIVRSSTDLLQLADKYGAPPLPPYLHRDATAQDVARYQTVFAQNAGSVAAPTASLNMTENLLKKIRAKGVIVKYLTLHVGLGTFLPIRTDEVEKHQIHSEYFEIPADTANAVKAAQRVVAVGTTVARTLEYYAQSGKTTGEADIFIYPGYKFKTVDALLTNFHAPRSTVLMLAAAFAGAGNLKQAYRHAIQQEYQFLSYGDSMFITS